jgi:hypothetical protein
MLRSRFTGSFARVVKVKVVGIVCLFLSVGSVSHAQTVLLNDSFADGTRTTSSGVVQPVWVGASTSDNTAYYTATTETLANAANTVTGKMQNLIGTGSRKAWVYFTPDQQTPDTNNPPTDILSMSVGQTLTASMTFVMPTTVYTTGNVPGPSANTLSTGSAQSDFRFGFFNDTNNARVQSDSNSDSGGGNWVDSQGYASLMGVGSNLTGVSMVNPQFLLEKRTSTGSANLIASSAAYTPAARAGTIINETLGTQYTVQMVLHEVSATQMDVTSNMYQGTDTGTLLSTATVSDIGTGDASTATFGGVAIVGANNAVPGNGSIYTKFDQFFFRLAGSTDTAEIDITNFKVTLNSAVTVLKGDMNFDGHVDTKDISAMELALTNTTAYLSTNFGNGTPSSHGATAGNLGSYADVTGGTTFNNSDVQALLTYLIAGHGSATAVPEPTGCVLAGLGAVAIGLVGWRRKKAA